MTLAVVSLSLATGCAESDGEASSDEGGLETLTSAGTSMDATGDTAAEDSSASADSSASDTASGDASATGDTTDTSAGDECSDYRSMYPVGPYATATGSVLAEVPGMVLPDGTMTGFEDIYGDKTKVALMLVNAFDT